MYNYLLLIQSTLSKNAIQKSHNKISSYEDKLLRQITYNPKTTTRLNSKYTTHDYISVECYNGEQVNDVRCVGMYLLSSTVQNGGNGIDQVRNVGAKYGLI